MPKSRMQTILVTGGAGFIGSNFVRLAIQQPDMQIVVLDKLTYAGHLDSLPSRENQETIRFVRGDIGDAALVTDLLAKYQPTAVFNFAAETHVDRSIDSPNKCIKTNVLGTGILLSQCLDYWEGLSEEQGELFRFLHVSTDEVYGSLGPTGKFTEETRYQPNSPYSASKAASDHLVRAYWQTYGLPTIITHCSNNYGPYQFPEKLIPTIILNAVRRNPIPIYGDGKNIRDWLHVTDHCHALLALSSKATPGETYNVGGETEKSNLDVARAVCQAVDCLSFNATDLPCESLIEFVADRPGHDQRYAVDTSKIASEIGWHPTVDFESGIQSTVAWYLANESWIKKKYKRTGKKQKLNYCT